MGKKKDALEADELVPLKERTQLEEQSDAKKAKILRKQFDDELYRKKNEEKRGFINFWRLKEFTFFHYACKKGDPAVVRHLISQGEDVNVKTLDGVTPLFSACAEGFKEVVELLIQHGANINTTAAEGFHKGLNPLYWACVGGHVEVAELLLQHGADLNAADPTGLTALMDASRQGHEKVVDLLIQNRANVNASVTLGAYAGWKALHFAQSERRHEVVKLLKK